MAFGLFTILCGTWVALYADRLSHRRRLLVLTDYFEHILQLPLAYHGETHSGRLMKIMLQGADTLWSFWLGFFREHLAAFISLFILVPLSLVINWRLANPPDCALRAVCIAHGNGPAQDRAFAEHRCRPIIPILPSEHPTRSATSHWCKASPGSRPKCSALRSVSERLLAAQFPVLSWWAIVSVLTRASTTLAVLSIILLGTWLFKQGTVTIGEIVTFMALAGMVITRLDQAVELRQPHGDGCGASARIL